MLLSNHQCQNTVLAHHTESLLFRRSIIPKIRVRIRDRVHRVMVGSIRFRVIRVRARLGLGLELLDLLNSERTTIQNTDVHTKYQP